MSLLSMKLFVLASYCDSEIFDGIFYFEKETIAFGPFSKLMKPLRDVGLTR